MTAESIAAELHATKSGKGWKALCPAHNDKKPSLHIHELDGQVLVHCFAGCTQYDVIRKLVELGLWEPRQMTSREREAQRERRYYEERAKEARQVEINRLDKVKLKALNRGNWSLFIAACRAQGQLLKLIHP